MKTITIDRTKWSRGKQSGNALLVTFQMEDRQQAHPDYPNPKGGHMCCLGFACIQSGAKPEDILGKSYPGQVGILLEGLNYLGEHGLDNTEFSREAASINDDGSITDAEREERLIALAKDYGFNFVFIN